MRIHFRLELQDVLKHAEEDGTLKVNFFCHLTLEKQLFHKSSINHPYSFVRF